MMILSPVAGPGDARAGAKSSIFLRPTANQFFKT
jgi:hypothetical protein